MDTVEVPFPVVEAALFEDTDVVPALFAVALLTEEELLLLASEDDLEVGLDEPITPREVLLLVPRPRRTVVDLPANTRSSPTV